MADPTLETLERFDRPAAWDHIEDNVPIFAEHTMYQVEQGGDKPPKSVVVMPGEKPPTGEGVRLLYEVTADDLEETAASINRNVREYAKPIKIFLGHTKNPKEFEQTEQPELVGYYYGARVGPWGPAKKLAVLSKAFYRRGRFNEAKEYPERSPEFYPGKNEITAVALLKTDPRLSMGMTTYTRSDGAVLYGRGFDMPEEATKVAPEAENHDDGLDDLNEDEAKMCARMFKHAQQHHPLFKYMATKYGAEMAQPGPTNGELPREAPPEPKAEEKPAEPVKKPEEDEEAEQMHRTDEMVRMMKERDEITKNQAREIAGLRFRNKQNDVREKVRDLEGRVVISEKARARVMERYMKADEQEWSGIDEEILEAYQPRNGDPTTDPRLPVPIDYAADHFDATDFNPAYDQKAAEHYCQERNLDPADPEHWDAACEAAVAKRKERAQKNGAVKAGK